MTTGCIEPISSPDVDGDEDPGDNSANAVAHDRRKRGKK